MNTIDRIAWAVLFLFGGFVIYESVQIKYYGSDFGPGPGFFSFWLGVLVVGLSAIEVRRTFGKHVPLPADFFPNWAALRRIGSLLGALVATIFLLEPLGYSLTMALFSVFLLRALGKQPWWLTVILTLAGSFGTAYIFRQLQVILPGGILGM